MNAIEMLEAQIDEIKSAISYDTKQLDNAVKEFKETVARYTAYEIANGYLDSMQRRIADMYNRIKEKHNTLDMLEYMLKNLNEQ